MNENNSKGQRRTFDQRGGGIWKKRMSLVTARKIRTIFIVASPTPSPEPLFPITLYTSSLFTTLLYTTLHTLHSYASSRRSEGGDSWRLPSERMGSNIRLFSAVTQSYYCFSNFYLFRQITNKCCPNIYNYLLVSPHTSLNLLEHRGGPEMFLASDGRNYEFMNDD